MWQISLEAHEDFMPSFTEVLENVSPSVACFKKPYTDHWQIDAYFEEKPPLETLETAFSDLKSKIKAAFIDFKVTEVQNENWLEMVHQAFPAFEVGSFYVYGSHITEKPPENKVPLQVDAATAFGSGEHETTRGALEMIEAQWHTKQIERPLDVGCGSGILAIAMAKLWPVQTWAVDLDEESTRVAKVNCQINGVDEHVTILCGDGVSHKEVRKNKSFDLVVANILAGPLMEMAPDIAEVMEKKGTLILSGILDSQKDKVFSVYEYEGFTLNKTHIIGEWATLVFEKR